MLKILLLGANGQLGRTFLRDRLLEKWGRVIPATRSGESLAGAQGEPVDMSSPHSVRALLDRIQPDVIVNAAAYTAVDRAEQEEELATLVNGTSVGIIGDWAAQHGALVIHYSTDYVFNGEADRPYAPEATTSPLGAYGRSKLIGEQNLRASGAHHFLFRTAWVYASHGHNFLLTMLRIGAERDELHVVADQFGAPTSTNLIAAATATALVKWLETAPGDRESMEGTHHLVASGQTSWHGFATAIYDRAFDRSIIDKKPLVSVIRSVDYPTPAKRPAYSVLDNTGFQNQFAFPLPDWSEGLDLVLRELSSREL